MNFSIALLPDMVGFKEVYFLHKEPHDGLLPVTLTMLDLTSHSFFSALLFELQYVANYISSCTHLCFSKGLVGGHIFEFCLQKKYCVVRNDCVGILARNAACVVSHSF